MLKKIRNIVIVVLLLMSLLFMFARPKEKPIDADDWNVFELGYLDRHEEIRSFELITDNVATTIIVHTDAKLSLYNENRAFRDVRYFFYETLGNSEDSVLNMIFFYGNDLIRSYDYTNGENWVIEEE